MDYDLPERIRRRLKRSPVERYPAAPARVRPDPTARYSIFASIAILSLGSIVYSSSQIVDGENQLADLARAQEQLAPRLKAAQDQQKALYTLGMELLQLSETDPAAKQLVLKFKIQRNPISTGRTASTDDSP